MYTYEKKLYIYLHWSELILTCYLHLRVRFGSDEASVRVGWLTSVPQSTVSENQKKNNYSKAYRLRDDDGNDMVLG